MTRRVAVTNHAVDRYQERVDGAKDFDKESVRSIIRDLVAQGFESGTVLPHPTEAERRIIPFKSGASVLYLSIGPNTTTFEAEFAVIGVLFEKEVTMGKIEMGITLEDVASEALSKVKPTKRSPPAWIVFVGEGDVEMYEARTLEEVLDLLADRKEYLRVYRLERELY